MNRPSLHDEIYSAIAEPERWSNVLTRLSDQFDAIGGMIVYAAPPGGKNLMTSARLDPDRVDIFHKYYTWNPWTRAMLGQPYDKAIVMESLVERGSLEKSAFFADVLNPLKVVDNINYAHRSLSYDGGIGGFGFCLSARGIEHAEDSRRKLQALIPHLSRALDATMRLAPLIGGTRQLVRVLQLMPNAALLLDAKQKIVHANQAAEALLRSADALVSSSNDGAQLSAVFPDDRIALARSLAQAMRVADGSSESLGAPLRLTSMSGSAPLLLLPIPLPPPAFSLWELTETARLLVIVIDPNTQHQGATSALQTGFGLTVAEARVAALVGSGLSGPQAAELLGVSPATVKTHLARCFDKVGVRSQVELARVIAAMPVTPASFEGTS